MFKIIGGMIVLVTSAAIGFDKANNVSLHRKELEEIQRIFTMIQTELKYIKTPLGEMFLKLQNKTEGKYKSWLIDISKELQAFQQGTFEEIWNTSIENHFKESFLTKLELEELKQIGKNISHMEALDLFLTQIELFIQYTREEEKAKKKLYQSMGIMAGIFLVIMLI